MSKTETKTVVVSTTDPECGLFHKGEHEKQFAYSVHTACDSHGFILGLDVSPGNVHDSAFFFKLYEQITRKFPQSRYIVADAGYKTPAICKKVFEDGRIAVLPYKRPMSKKGFFKPYEYVYDEYFHCVLCPNEQVLSYQTTTREGYRQFKSNPLICKDCPFLLQCTHSQNHTKIVQKHIWADFMEQAEDVRHSSRGKYLYSLRSQTIERVFADAKQKHAMRTTTLKGKRQMKKTALLTFAAMNLKKLANWLEKAFKTEGFSGYFCQKIIFLQNFLEKETQPLIDWILIL